MSVSKRLSARLNEVFQDGKWIANTNYREQLMQTQWKDALIKYDGLNSVALLVFHINYYLEGILQVFRGGHLTISDKFSFDLPELKSEEEWDTLRNNLLNNASDFAEAVEIFPDTKLEEIFVDERYGNYGRNIEAVIEHSYYHLGQIVLIRKLIKDF